MTPSEMLSKYKETGSAAFLSELEGEDMWAFLETPMNDVLAPFNQNIGVYDYDRLRLAVVAEKRREYFAEVDVWMNHFAHQHYGHAKAKNWIETLQKIEVQNIADKMHLHDVIQYLKEL